MMSRSPVSIVWLRRDLRLDDNAALSAAARGSQRVVCAFVLDGALLRGPRVGAPIVQFFFDSLRALRADLRAAGSDLALLAGDAAEELGALARRVEARAVYHNLDYDPEGIARDACVARALGAAGIDVHASLDHVYFGAGDVLRDDGAPYTVYTPYRRRWEARFAAAPHPPLASARAVRPLLAAAAAIGPSADVPRPEDYGFVSNPRYPRGGSVEGRRLLRRFLAAGIGDYAQTRNVPALEGTSRLSPHLRAGTLGVRAVVHAAAALRADAPPSAATGIATWLGELVWRDFYAQLLAHRPQLARDPFVVRAQRIPYRHDEEAFAAWCAGRTGYPIVDAAMRQLNDTGWMHNRLRMIVASFLTKHLLIDYRWGERYFETHLADADLASNNGGWQWAASTGTDAAPYFRVFNPTLQGKSFDPGGAFVRAMLPELARVPERFVHEPWRLPPLLQAEAGCSVGRDYPAPIVEHAFARGRALAAYGAALAREPIDVPLSSP